MSESLIEESILSRPKYGQLAIAPGLAHYFVADASGAECVIRVAQTAPKGFMEKVHILYVPTPGENALTTALYALGAKRFEHVPTIDAAIAKLGDWLSDAKMGSQLYLAGTEGLIGRAVAKGEECGLDHTAVQCEHRGSLARRVQCVHCKTMIEKVTTQPVKCPSCDLLLLVRDHYSRRLAAFQGVCINAEDPTEEVEIREVFK
ncbi:dimethylamine monooxygenase subunit DmmA family protein [Thalassospira povalilytica]|uniref:dimethylamine monooxygenase subunit DmmA family protein n=1 Tax=Thalassospira povalilytica TaxID=732237 RepID=UPI003AA7D5DC